MIKTSCKFNLISSLTNNYRRSCLISSNLVNLSKKKACSVSITKSNNFHSYSKWLAEDKEKFYALSMFPYPSGNLHMGHVRVYTISDTLARYQRMSNPASTQVIHPMGWDAFGLPAENAAIERGINPKDWTLSNIGVMKNQLSLMDTKFDWDKEVITCNKDYYKFTQKLILLLHEHGLLYQKEALVNWDPVDKTVLANEQVDSEGRSWRSGAIVEQKYLKQWFVKITDYAEDLLKDLELLTGWPEKVRTMQSNWIGKSEGCEINFKLSLPNTDLNKLTVFTTRADTLYGVQYLAVSLNHPIIKSALVTDEVRDEVNRVKSESKDNEELSMEGVNLGIDVIHPLTKESIPVYAAPYVLEDYGTGSVMGVPAHDQRDWNFFHLNEISKNLKFVIGPSADPDHLDTTQPFLEDGIMLSLGKNGSFGAKTSIQARKSITDLVAQEGAGKAVNQYRLRDWLISRQRYWGAPIPFIHCDSCGVVPVPDEQLPVELPDLDVLSNEGGSPLAKSSEFVNCQCPKCKGPAKRDTDTMDTFVDSSWYFLRHLDAKNSKEIFDQKIVSKQMPVDLYIGGIEHAILHLLYSRFITKFLWKNGYLNSTENQEPTDLDKMRGEPFKKLLTQGMVQGKTYKSSTNGRFVKLDDVKVIDQYQAVHKETNDPLIVTYEKMSKSKYNGVDPEKTIKLNGVDSTRLYMLYKAPPSDNLDWDDHSIIGIKRWLNKIDKLIETPSKQANQINLQELNQEAKNLYRVINFTIKEVTQSFETNYQFNTAIAFLIKLTHSLTDYSQLKGFNTSDAVYNYGVKVLIQMLSPMAPRKAQSLWDQYFITKSGDKVEECRWPQVDLEGLKEDKVNVVIQINGKKRQVADLSVDVLDELLPQSLTLDKLGSANYEEFLEKIVNPEIREKFIGQKKVFKVIVGNNRKLVNYLVK